MVEKEGKLERKTYTFEQAQAASLKYFQGDNLAAEQWIRKYALKDSKGNIYEDSPDKMHHRLANEVARIEGKYKGPNQLSKKEIYSLFEDFKYLIPGGSNMSGIGNNNQIVSLSNCFALGNDFDSYGGIIDTDQQQVQLMKRRGGVGHDLSHIRPKGRDVKNSALTSTGVVPFMERYSNSTREVAQDGRRGALMLSLSIKHPDVEDFIDAKMTKGKVTGANVSVKIDDEFMEAVKNNTKYTQQYPVDSDNPTITKEINATDLWDKIIHNAWKFAEPGVLFWDTIQREAIPDNYARAGIQIIEGLKEKYGEGLEGITTEDEKVFGSARNLADFKTISTNPCGEIPLCPYDSCRLLAINLYNYVENPFTDKSKFKGDLFEKHARNSLRIMDDIIDLEKEKIEAILKKIDSDPEPDYIKDNEKRLWEKILEKTNQGRRTGIGITAEGDMLAALGLRYGSDEAIEFSTKVHKTLALEVYGESVELAKERGAFEIYDAEKEKDNPFIMRIKEADPELYKEMVEHGRRNIALLTIAPTGTTSIMTQTTSGIEPAFTEIYKRNVKVEANDKNTSVDYIEEGIKWHTYNVFHPKFKEWLIINGYDSEKLEKMDTKEFKKEVEEIVVKSPYYGATSKDVDWIKKVEMQGEIQKWIDHSISATTNLPKDTPKEVVAKVYMEAYDSGCKGMTVYREGSRGRAILNSDEDLEGKVKFPKERPGELDADILRFKNNDENGGEDWIAFIGKINEKPFEIFTGRSQGAMLQIPKIIKEGKIKKSVNEKGSWYDFIYVNEVGFDNVIGGISHQFSREYWNLARLVSGHLREGTPIPNLVRIVKKLDDGTEGINTWKSGVERALKKYIPDGTDSGEICKECNNQIIFQDGCETCGCEGKCG